MMSDRSTDQRIDSTPHPNVSQLNVDTVHINAKQAVLHYDTEEGSSTGIPTRPTIIPRKQPRSKGIQLSGIPESHSGFPEASAMAYPDQTRPDPTVVFCARGETKGRGEPSPVIPVLVCATDPTGEMGVPSSGPRVQSQPTTSIGRGRVPSTGPPLRARETTSIGRRRAPPPDPPVPRSEQDKFKSRCCYFLLIGLFAVALVLMGFSIATLAVKDADVRKHCHPLPCFLGCDDGKLLSFYRGCAIVYGGGGVVCMVAVLFLTTLVTRACFGVKVFGACVVFEMFVLVILLAVALGMASTLTLGIASNKSCVKKRCPNLDILDVLDFLKQSEISAWLSNGIILFIVFVWAVLSCRTCCHEMRSVRRRQGERQYLLS